MEAILKNQFKQVSLAVSFTLSGEKLSEGKKNQGPRNSHSLSGNKLLYSWGWFKTIFSFFPPRNQAHHNKLGNMFASQLSHAAVRAEYTDGKNK